MTPTSPKRSLRVSLGKLRLFIAMATCAIVVLGLAVLYFHSTRVTPGEIRQLVCRQVGCPARTAPRPPVPSRRTTRPASAPLPRPVVTVTVAPPVSRQPPAAPAAPARTSAAPRTSTAGPVAGSPSRPPPPPTPATSGPRLCLPPLLPLTCR